MLVPVRVNQYSRPPLALTICCTSVQYVSDGDVNSRPLQDDHGLGCRLTRDGPRKIEIAQDLDFYIGEVAKIDGGPDWSVQDSTIKRELKSR